MLKNNENRHWRIWLVPKGHRIRSENADVHEVDHIQICGVHFIPFGLAGENLKEWMGKKNKSGVSAKIKHKYVLGEFANYDEALEFAKKMAKEHGYDISKYD